MKVLVTGAKGQLGQDIVKILKENQFDVFETDLFDLDFTKENDVIKYFKNLQVDGIIHCAAYTMVDQAEIDQQKCFDVNVFGTKYLLNEAIKQNAKFLFISTDYVFDGKSLTPYQVDDQPNAISVYGKSKQQAEEIVKQYHKSFIVRTTWVFGKNGNNIIKTMINLASTKDEIKVVDDQVGSLTYTIDLANLIKDMIQTNYYGIYHATNEGYTSAYTMVSKLVELIGSKVKITPIKSSEYKTLAKRPQNSRLSKSKLDIHFKRLPKWEDALNRFLRELEENK